MRTRYVRVAAAAINQTPLSWEANQRRILEAIALARARGATILCLPELCTTGYGCEDAFYSPSTLVRAREMAQHVAAHSRGMVVSIGLPMMIRKSIFNCVAILVDGRVAGVIAKRFLPGDGVHYEPRWFKPWQEAARVDVPFGGDLCAEGDETLVPVGDLLLDVGQIRIGLEICEDAWVPDRPGANLARRGVDVILNPSASHFAFGKQEVRKRFVLEGSRSFGCSYVYSNLLGNEAGRIIYDGSTLIAADAKLVAIGPRFSYREVVVTDAVIDVLTPRARQAQVAGIRPDLAPDPGRVAIDFDWPELGAVPAQAPRLEPWESSLHLREEETTRAIALGLHDYVRKSRSRGFVVSLSGGCDSAVVSVLVSDMLALASAELGDEELHRRLGLGSETRTHHERVRAFLTTLYQPTRNSGSVTREAAAAVAEALGSEHHQVDVDDMVQGYISRCEAAIGRKLDWRGDDITLQNVQARARGPSAWMLANVKGALLLATSNRSEAAVGYATMDGDTCGGLSPITGLDKAYLRRWLRWRQEPGPLGLSPIPALAKVTAQQPTAELRPPGEEQTDEKDLMPFEILEAIEESFVRDRMSPREILDRLAATFGGAGKLSRADLLIWLERFLVLWSRNQWKRERYAVAFHLDDESLDPKTWCRYPILSGGFGEELAELRRELLG